MVAGRALHFVFKIADRPKNIHFFREILGMKVSSYQILRLLIKISPLI